VARGRRKSNPSTTTWLLVGAAALATAGAAVLVFLPRKQGRGPGSLPGSGRDPIPELYVGKTGYQWPHSDLFPQADAFGDALERFGYETGDWLSDKWSVLGSEMQDAVRSFQEDYNAVRKTIEQPPTPKLSVTGRLDADTVNALAYVSSLIEQTSMLWPNIVYDTRSAGVA
jgi:hypothetical protein